MNLSTDVHCCRYIDDFLILAPSRSVAENTFSKATRLLARLGLQVSSAKTERSDAIGGFEFLGIELANGLIRPCKNKRERHVASIREVVQESMSAFNTFARTGGIEKHLEFIPTMKKVSGMNEGWGKSYWFCNDAACLATMNSQIGNLIRNYVKSYSQAYAQHNQASWSLMGLETLGVSEDRKFRWP